MQFAGAGPSEIIGIRYFHHIFSLLAVLDVKSVIPKKDA